MVGLLSHRAQVRFARAVIVGSLVAALACLIFVLAT